MGRFDLCMVLIGFCSLAAAQTRDLQAVEASPCLEAPDVGTSREAVARCLYEEGLEQEKKPEAERRLADLATRNPDDGWAVYYRALLNWEKPLAAEPLLRQAEIRFANEHEVRGELLARANRQRVLITLQRPREAGREARRAAELGDNSGSPELRARGRIVLARQLLMGGGDLETAYTVLSELSRSLPGDAPYSIFRDTLAHLGSVAVEIGRLPEATSAYSRLQDLARRNEDTYYEALAWYGLTRIASERLVEDPSAQRSGEVRRLAERALTTARQAGYESVQAKAHWVLGSLGPLDGAPAHLKRCAALAPTVTDRSYCLGALARRLAVSNPSQAIVLADRAKFLAVESKDPIARAFAERDQMRVAWGSEAPVKATADSWAALDAIETLRDLQPEGSDVQAGLFSTWADDYLWFSGRLLRAGREGKADAGWAETRAFEVTERMRARSLVDALHAAKVEPMGPPGPSGGSFATLEAVRRALAPDQALLSFQVAPSEDLSGDFGGGSWLTSVTRAGVHVDPLPDRGALRDAVALFDGLFTGPEGREEVGEAVAARLYGRLLAPALARLPPGITRLILVPDDALHRLPFDALRAAPGEPPLGARYALSRVPSATLWLRWRSQAPPRAPRAALVLADPSSPPAASKLALAPLAHARSEGWEVAHALGRGSSLLEGDEASEAAVKGNRLADFGVLHLAAHAVTDETHPERSAVILAAGAPAAAGGGEDGMLRAAEIARLHLGSRVVVLGSCRSAGGQVLRGEGVMSLARAFFQAGARTVVATLWPVRDADAEALFERFYHHLARGETVASALRSARRDRIAAGAPPSAWAGFVALGDGDARPVTAGGWRLAWTLPWIWITAGCVLLALTALAAWRLDPGASRRRRYPVFHTTR